MRETAVEHARRDDVDRDAAAGDLTGHRPGEATEAGLGSRVVGLSGVAEQAGDGAHEHDAAAALIKACPTGPDVVVCNAGVTRDGISLMMSDEAFDEVIDANLSASFRTARAALRTMLRARKGRVIFVGSVAGLLGNAGQANYSAAKAGLGGLARALAREVAARGITVNVVAPGVLEGGLAGDGAAEGLKDLEKTIPAGRRGRADEVAAAVAFLASDSAGYITGTTLAVDGGLAMGC